MRRLLAIAALAVFSAVVHAQDADPLAVTLSNGKVIHFQTDEQKAKYEAALQKRSAVPLAVAAPPKPKPAESEPIAPDEKPVSARVNVSAPAFTADYYLSSPAGWMGKKVTLSVGYFSNPYGAAEMKDGLQKLVAQTYNNTPGVAGNQSFGGEMTVLAKPESANKLKQQCGTRFQYQASGWIRTTLIKGEIRPVETKRKSAGNSERYAFYVED